MLWLASIVTHYDYLRIILSSLCLLFTWAWLNMPVGHKPNHRHPYLRRIAEHPKIIAWRSRDAWLPSSRNAKLWWLVLAGLLGIGAGLAMLNTDIWWVFFTPLLILGATLFIDIMVLSLVFLWPFALLLAVFSIDMTLSGAISFAIGLIVSLLGLFFADLARALYQQRSKL